MLYRAFGKTDLRVSALGFGAMRLPTHNGSHSGAGIDEAEAMRMIHHAIDQGVNYIDTAYVYHEGQSEILVGKALNDGHRAKVLVATKSPVWLLHKESDFDTYLNEQLQRLQTDVIDCYLLHALNRARWRNTILPLNVLGKAEAAIRDGRIRHLGFSFHGPYEEFEEILREFERWSFCQIQYNYMDTENQAGEKGLLLAASQGLGVVVMEPLLGGRLANPPKAISDAMDRFSVRRTPVDWALQWLWDQPAISNVLSGMSTMDQLEANLSSAAHSRTGSLSSADQNLIAFARERYRERTVIPCTKCGYCVPCPSGVDIPGVFELFNDAHLYDDIPGAKFRYTIFLDPSKRADACTQCEDCLSKCPQNINITAWLPKVTELLGA